MTDIERAVSQISDIRSQLAASTRFRGYAPEAVALIGLLALALMAAQLAWPARFAAGDVQQVLFVGALILVANLIVLVEAIGRSRRQHGSMASTMLKGAIRAQLPVGFLGVAVGVVVLVRAPEAAWVLPGLWQMLIGITAMGSYSIMPRPIVWPAAWFLAAGAAVMWIAGSQGQLTPVLTCLPLVLGHFAIAWVLHRGEYR